MVIVQQDIIRIFPELLQIKEEGLRESCTKVWLQAIEESGLTDEAFLELLCHKSLQDCPITLVGHTRGVMKLSMRMAEQLIEDYSSYVALRMDHVIAAACLHDVGKVYEHRRDAEGNILWEARYLHHPFTGAALAWRMGIPSEIVYAIANHSHEGEKSKDIPLLFVIRMADETYYRYLHFGFGKKAKPGWE